MLPDNESILEQAAKVIAEANKRHDQLQIQDRFVDVLENLAGLGAFERDKEVAEPALRVKDLILEDHIGILPLDGKDHQLVRSETISVREMGKQAFVFRLHSNFAEKCITDLERVMEETKQAVLFGYESFIQMFLDNKVIPYFDYREIVKLQQSGT